MPVRLFNLARMTVAGPPGTGAITLGAAVPGFLTFAQAGVLNNQIIRYGAKDGNAREVGYATYNSASTSLSARTPMKSTNADAAINLSANAIVSILPAAEDFATIAPLCGKLYYTSPTALGYYPFNGDKLKINGKLYDIPGGSAGGLPGLTNTNCILNGVGGQNLTAANNYLVVAMVSGGKAIGGFSSYTSHTRSQVVDNEGVEISGQYGDAMTVIGMVRVNPSAQFGGASYTLSWHNRRFRETHSSFGNASTQSPSHVDLVGYLYAMNWADEELWIAWSTQAGTTDNGGYASIDIGVDSADAGLMQIVYYNATTLLPINLAGWTLPAEGLHSISGRGGADRNNGTTLSCYNSVLGVGTMM